MKRKYEGEDSENEFSVDEPDELQESDDDWTPGPGEGGRRQSRRLRNSTSLKKIKNTEPTTSDEEDEDDDDDEEEEESAASDESGSDSKNRKKKKGKSSVKTGKSRTKKSTVTPLKSKADNVVRSCEATSTTPIQSHPGPVEKEFTSGSFVVLKTDFLNGGDPPIWKIDGKALLQKYIPFEQDGKILYKNTSTYSGWSVNNKDQYYSAPIHFKMQNRKETIVEFLKDSIKKEEDSE